MPPARPACRASATSTPAAATPIGPRRAGSRDAIAATELDTVYGPIKFDAAGRNVAKPMVLTQVQGGKYVVVYPRKSAAGTPVVPRPLP